MPVREVPRDVHGERARSDDEEDRGTDYRGGALHNRSILHAAANPADWASAGVALMFNVSDDRELRTSDVLDLRSGGLQRCDLRRLTLEITGAPASRSPKIKARAGASG